MMRLVSAALVAASIAMPAFAQAPTPPAAVREITKIKDEVYRFRNNGHYSVFAVTSAGIIATDPINAPAATWLKDELRKRWPDKPIKFVVYSHDHADHISGGEVWTDTATVVAHENAREPIVGEKRPTPPPQITFSDKATIDLGGTAVELIAVDFIPVKGVAFRDFPDAYLDEWIDSLRKVEALEFDILAPGHGALGGKADVTNFRLYLEDLRGQVLAAVRAGKSLDETRKSVDLSRYKDWGGYEQMSQLNIEGAYRLVQGTRRPNQ